jgi:hypothetical protein
LGADSFDLVVVRGRGQLMDDEEREQILEDVRAAAAATQANIFRLAEVLGISHEELITRAQENTANPGADLWTATAGTVANMREIAGLLGVAWEDVLARADENEQAQRDMAKGIEELTERPPDDFSA